MSEVREALHNPDKAMAVSALDLALHYVDDMHCVFSLTPPVRLPFLLPPSSPLSVS